MVDAADEMRYKIASYEFDQAVNHQDVRYRKIPILVFLNKVDVKVRPAHAGRLFSARVHRVPVSARHQEQALEHRVVSAHQGRTLQQAPA